MRDFFNARDILKPGPRLAVFPLFHGAHGCSAANKLSEPLVGNVVGAHKFDELHAHHVPLMREGCQGPSVPDKGNADLRGRWHVPLMRYPNNLKKLQAIKGWTLDQAAAAMGISRGGYIKIQRGENRLTSTTIELAAKAFDVSNADIVGQRGGRVRSWSLHAAADGDSITVFSDAQGPRRGRGSVRATKDTVAVRIRGTSLGRMFDGWLAFYDEVRNSPERSMLNDLCVCGPRGRPE